MQLPSDIYRHTDNVKMLGLQKVIHFIICKAFCHQSFYSLIVLKYLDNDDLIRSKTSLKYKQYKPIIVAKYYMVIQSQGVKIHLDI